MRRGQDFAVRLPGLPAKWSPGLQGLEGPQGHLERGEAEALLRGVLRELLGNFRLMVLSHV